MPRSDAPGGGRWWQPAATFVILVLAGCGSTATSVSGLVTMDGQPLARALVRFFPAGPTGQTGAVFTDSEGRYRAEVSPAPLRVVISARKVVGQEKNDTVPGGPPLDITEESVPPCYSDVRRTILSIHPVANRNTPADFALSSRGQAAGGRP